MAVFIVLWPSLLTTKLKSVICHNVSHSNPNVSSVSILIMTEVFNLFFFPFSLPKGGLALGRQEVHAVAEQRKHEIARFLKSLFSSQLARESDLVYTFFHPLLRDQQDADIHLPKLRGM